jgi:hypothetical protein
MDSGYNLQDDDDVRVLFLCTHIHTHTHTHSWTVVTILVYLTCDFFFCQLDTIDVNESRDGNQ